MLTLEDKKARLQTIGASEAAAVLGVDPYKTAFEVWTEKTGRCESFKGNDATDAGNRFEPVILDWAEEQLGTLKRNRRMVLDGHPIAATCDALTTDLHPVEAKTGGLFAPLSDVWGREGTDEIPERYIVQLQVQMLCTGSDLGHLAAFLGGIGFRMYRVPRSPRLTSFIRERLADWWTRYVVTDTPPEHDPMACQEVYRRIARTPNKVVSIGAGLVADYELASDIAKAADEAKERAKTGLIVALGDAEVGDFDGPKQVTFYDQGDTRIDATALRRAHPEIAEQFTIRKSKRVLRVVKKKGE